MEKIPLIWADKFRSLTKTYKTDKEIIFEFKNYCVQQEKELNERWAKKNKIFICSDCHAWTETKACPKKCFLCGCERFTEETMEVEE